MIHVTQSALGQIIDIFNKRKKAIGLSKYSVGDILDHGGMSNIYVVSDGSGNTDYVLRVSEEHKSPYSHDIFNVRELKILQELQKNRQPHVVQYLDAFAVDVAGYPRYYCAVMKFLNTLKQYRVKGDGVEIAVRLGSDFLPLLQSFTDKSILHRDIKPANIFYDADFRNETGFLLGDFGIAKRDTDTSVTPTGTESTMAPEVRGLDRSLGSDRSRSDMYSLGVVMYLYLNEGIYPSNRERIDRMPPDTAPFPAPRFGSKRLKNLVIKATSYYPNDRFDSLQRQRCILDSLFSLLHFCKVDFLNGLGRNESELLHGCRLLFGRFREVDQCIFQAVARLTAFDTGVCHKTESNGKIFSTRSHRTRNRRNILEALAHHGHIGIGV